MDVSLNNVLESTRQYFQGVPSGVGVPPSVGVPPGVGVGVPSSVGVGVPPSVGVGVPPGVGVGVPPAGAAPLQPHGPQPNPPAPTSSPYWPGRTNRPHFNGPHEPTEPHRTARLSLSVADCRRTAEVVGIRGRWRGKKRPVSEQTSHRSLVQYSMFLGGLRGR
ncbi:hypothetical protein AAG570_002517 [Ranatra chinensis]|uniref:Uncharacterized protein n=1 Tax=Ranatra chinensis TaxID=642074 RepID=A0ABD0Y865_9HEMI